jgi:hypothetical protein
VFILVKRAVVQGKIMENRLDAFFIEIFQKFVPPGKVILHRINLNL